MGIISTYWKGKEIDISFLNSNLDLAFLARGAKATLDRLEDLATTGMIIVSKEGNFQSIDWEKFADKARQSWQIVEPIAEAFIWLGILSTESKGHWAIISSGEVFSGPMIRGVAHFFGALDDAKAYAKAMAIGGGVVRFRKISEETEILL